MPQPPSHTSQGPVGIPGIVKVKLFLWNFSQPHSCVLPFLVLSFPLPLGFPGPSASPSLPGLRPGLLTEQAQGTCHPRNLWTLVKGRKNIKGYNEAEQPGALEILPSPPPTPWLTGVWAFLLCSMLSDVSHPAPLSLGLACWEVWGGISLHMSEWASAPLLEPGRWLPSSFKCTPSPPTTLQVPSGYGWSCFWLLSFSDQEFYFLVLIRSHLPAF